MQIRSKVLGIVVLAFGAAACGDDGGGGSGGSGGAETSTVSGTVETEGDAGNAVPVEGATVSVLGTSISATTDELGQFVLEDVPNGEVFFSTAAAGHWGTVDFYDVPEETGAPIELGLVPDAQVAGIAEMLGRPIDPALGVVDVTFQDAEGGESASISAPSDDPFTFDGDELRVQDEVVADEEGYADLVFTSVDPDDAPISASVTGAPGLTNCQINQSQDTEYPILPKSITIIYAGCTPAP